MLTELVVGEVVTVRQRFAHGRVEVDLLGDRMLDQRRHDLLGEQLHLLIGGTVHLLELREDVVYFPVLLGEERDYVSRCGGCRHVRGCTRPPAQRNEMPGCAGVKRHQSKPAICSCKYASVWRSTRETCICEIPTCSAI